MKKIDKDFILKLVQKELLSYSIALETRITENIKREINYFKIHLQYRINQGLMNIIVRKVDLAKLAFSFIHLSNCIREKIKPIVFKRNIY